MKAFASAMLGICAAGFSSTIASAQTHPLVGKWQTKVHGLATSTWSSQT